jgi:hypothetical protein
LNITDPAARRACPVCAAPARPATGRDVHCEGCGWQLSSPLRLGRATGRELHDFDADLLERQQQWDIDAAWRASVGMAPAEEAAFGLLMSVVRGELTRPPAPRRTQVPAEDEPTVTAEVLADVLRGTAAYRQLSLIEVGPAGLALWGASGASPEVGVLWSHSWPQVCPWVSTDPDAQRFQLAGGIGRMRPIGPQEWQRHVEDALEQIARHLLEPVLLVRPTPGWPLLDQAVHAVRARFAPRAELPSIPQQPALSRMVAEIMAAVPHPEGYDVLLARRDPRTGEMTVARQELFPSVVLAPGEERKTRLVVYGSPTGAPVVLPVVHHDAEAPATAVGVTSAVLHLAPGEQAVVDAYQDGPGRIRLEHPAAVDEPRPWQHFAPHLPELLHTGGADALVDLAITVELGGDQQTRDDVNARIEAARALISALSAHADDAPSLQVAVVGYGDHHYQVGWKSVVQPLGAPGAALARMEDWRAASRNGDLVAPLEDALDVVARLRWRPGSRRFAALFAGRPPHVPPGRGRLRPCDNQLDVRTVARQLRELRDVELFPVLTPPRWDSRREREAQLWADEIWPELASAGPFADVAACADALRARIQPSGLGDRVRLAVADAA